MLAWLSTTEYSILRATQPSSSEPLVLRSVRAVIRHSRAGCFGATKPASAARLSTTGRSERRVDGLGGGRSTVAGNSVPRAPSRVRIEEKLGPRRWVASTLEGAFQVVLNQTADGAERCESRTRRVVPNRTTGGVLTSKYSHWPPTARLRGAQRRYRWPRTQYSLAPKPANT